MGPTEILDLFKKYVKNLGDNPLLIHDFVGKDGDSANRKRSRLLTLPGFRKYAREQGINIRPLEKRLDLVDTFEDIKDWIYCENVEGGAAGVYAASIIQRLHGLVEKSEVQQKNIDVKMNLGNNKLNANNIPATRANELPN